MSLLSKAGNPRKRPLSATVPLAPPPTSATPPPPPDTLLVDAHAPKASADLAMHKKKVDEVRDWLRKADQMLQMNMPPAPRLLVLSGPPGSGKSTMLRVIATELGFETCEWVDPRSLSWEEDASGGRDGWNADGERRTDPRLTSFASFLRDSLRTLSLSIVPVGAPGASGAAAASVSPSDGCRRRLVVLEELAPLSGPSGTDTSARDAQIALIRRWLPSARYPLALVLSSDASNTVHHTLEQLRPANDTSAAMLVSEVKVNAVADTFLTKALRDVCARERIELSAADLSALVTSSNGDLRHALHSLQFIATGQPRLAPAGRGAGGGAAKKVSGKRVALPGGKRAPGGAAGSAEGSSAAGGLLLGGATGTAGGERDKFPDMFHAIGAILHRPSKRTKMLATAAAEHTIGSAMHPQEQRAPQRAAPFAGSFGPPFGSSSQGTASSSGSLTGSTILHDGDVPKPPMPPSLTDVDGAFMPEGVLESSCFEEPSAAAFLHQNYLECFSDPHDLAEAASYLSDAHCLVEAYRRRPWQQALLPYVASLAGRAVVTANRHPAPSRFLQTRKPQIYQVERDGLERRRRAMVSFHRGSAATAFGGVAASAFAGADAGGVMGVEQYGGIRGFSSLTVEIVPYLKFIAVPRGVHEHRVHLSHEQWKVMAELTTYAGGPPAPPHHQPPPLAQSIAPYGAAPAAPRAPFAFDSFIDDIEED